MYVLRSKNVNKNKQFINKNTKKTAVDSVRLDDWFSPVLTKHKHPFRHIPTFKRTARIITWQSNNSQNTVVSSSPTLCLTSMTSDYV